MDIARPDQTREKRRRRLIMGAVAGVVLLMVTMGLARLKPAAPTAERATLWIDVVKRGSMLREAHGTGTLVPVEVRWIPAASEARVERLLVQPGSTVTADTVLLEMSNPELELQALEAESRLRAAEAQYKELEVRLESQRLDQQASAARVESEWHQARLRADAERELAQNGLIADITRQQSELTASELARRSDIEKRRLDIGGAANQAQLAVQHANVEQQRALARLRRSQFDALRVRAGLAGVLQQLPVEVGQRVTPGTTLAKVAQPSRLKAVIHIPETQVRDVQPGQRATVDTRNGLVEARVARVDPAAQNGAVTVDLALDGQLPKGARPDLQITGTVVLEQLENVLYVGKPAMGQADSMVGLFRLDAAGKEANRVQVRLGRMSVSNVEIVGGLKEGEQVVLSDTSTWDAFDRLRID